MGRAAKLLSGGYMDMMDTMQTVVFEESEDEFGDSLSTFGTNSNDNMMEGTADLATSEQLPLLNTSSSPSKQQQHHRDAFQHQRDAFPDTKNSILERLDSNISQDNTVKTTKSRLKAVSHEGSVGGGGGVDLLHFDAPVRCF
jgi:hypothetical protein